MTADHLLPTTPFFTTGTFATVAPSWALPICEAEDPAAAARTFYDAATGPVARATHTVDGVAMVEVSFLTWADGASPRYLVAGGLAALRQPDPGCFEMRPVAGTPLRQVTFLLPADGAFSYGIGTVDPEALAAATGHERMRALWADVAPDPTNPELLSVGGLSAWYGPDFPHHPALDGIGCGTDASLAHRVVTHADGRERDVWTLRAASGTARTVLLFDGDTWRDRGIGARVWAAAGYDANLVLMSSMEMADRRQDLTEHAWTAATVREVLAALAQDWGLTIGADDVVVVGQSWGGLGVVALVVQHPDVARSGVCISGSFFVEPGVEVPDLAARGVHRQALDGGVAGGGRLALLVGSDELITEQSLRYAEEARAAGVEVTGLRMLRGGHDYAWWRHAIFHGIDTLGLN